VCGSSSRDDASRSARSTRRAPPHPSITCVYRLFGSITCVYRLCGSAPPLTLSVKCVFFCELNPFFCSELNPYTNLIRFRARQEYEVSSKIVAELQDHGIEVRRVESYKSL